MAINFSKIVEIRAMSIKNLFGDQGINNTSDLICKSIIMLNEEFGKRGDSNEWLSTPKNSLRSALDSAIHREDWKALITFSLMLAGVGANPASHFKRVLAEHVMYASRKDDTIKSLNTSLEDRKRVSGELRRENEDMQARISALVKENDEFCADIGNMSVEIRNLKSGYAAMAEDRDSQIKRLEADLAKSVAQYVQDQIGGINPAAGYRIRTQRDEINLLKKQLAAKTKEAEYYKKHLADFDREDEKSEGSVGTCSTIGVGSTPAYSREFEQYKDVLFSLFDDIPPHIILGQKRPLLPPMGELVHRHFSGPGKAPNCRCAMVPVIPGLDKIKEPESTTKIKMTINQSVGNVEKRYEIEGTVEEILKITAELGLN